MILFRVIGKNYVNEWNHWDKTGSYRKGARWNSAGTPVMYFSSNPQNAMLETSNYFATPRLANAATVMCVFECTALSLHSIEPSELPSNWDAAIAPGETRKLGDEHLHNDRYDGIIVPSVGIHGAIASHELNEIRESSYANVVLNPTRSRVAELRLIETLTPVFSQRMFA